MEDIVSAQTPGICCPCTVSGPHCLHQTLPPCFGALNTLKALPDILRKQKPALVIPDHAEAWGVDINSSNMANGRGSAYLP